VSLQQKYDKSLFLVLSRAAIDADREIRKYKDKEGIGAQVRVAQLMGARGAINRILSFMWRDVGRITRAGQQEAQAAAIEKSFDWEEVLLARAVPDKDQRDALREALIAAADKNVDAMIARVLKTHIPLSKQVYRTQALSNKWVERAINSALARGATVAELASDVKSMINPNTNGGVSYAAKRLARSEINNAYHSQSIDTARDKPWITGMRWNLSKSHPRRDRCNELSEADHGQGPGIYGMGQVPSKPHPQCLCYVVPETLSVSEFNRRLRTGQFDDYIESNWPAEFGEDRLQFA
jgi:hypothetical protein